jgi:hypothetical protein
MDKSIKNQRFAEHSPRFKPWAMKDKLKSTKPF